VKQLVRLVIASIALPSAASAQWMGGLGAQGQSSSPGAGPSTWQASTELGARFTTPFASTDGQASLARGDKGLSLSLASLRQQLFSPAWNGFRGLATLDYANPAHPGQPSSSSFTGSSSISYRRGMNGAWTGYRVERGAVGSLQLGTWRQVGPNLTVSISSMLRRVRTGGMPGGTYFDSIWVDTGGWRQYQVVRPGTPGTLRRWTENEATIGWQHGFLALDGLVGWRPAVDTSVGGGTWYRGSATVALGRNAALNLGAGRSAQIGPAVRTTGRYARVGVRFAPAALLRPDDRPEITPAAAAFLVDRVRSGEYVVRVRVPHARTVELSGDFNDWRPLSLTRDRDDSWTLSLNVPPGTYRMNIRVDGERWTPPPGAPSVEDEFNGKVGLVVIR
jgi:hypothetical protein